MVVKFCLKLGVNHQKSLLQKCDDVKENICEKIHKNKPHQFECEICGDKEQAGSCKRLDGGYSPVPDDVEVF